jgi:hypothetical protein
MPSTINAIPDITTGVLRKSGAADANLTFETNSIDAVVINGSQIANFVSTGAVTIPRGTTAQRPSSAVNGMFRANSNFGSFEVYVNGAWDNVTAVTTPINSVAPVVSGSTTVGGNATVTTGTWNNSPTSFAYQWRANTSSISNATSNVFTITSTQIGANLSCNVTAINAAGSNIPTTSNSVGPVTSTYTATYLSIAGGGGGGYNSFQGSGGGGAGGYLSNTTTITPGTVYTITVGAGGSSNAKGSNTSAFSVTPLGGGAGAGNNAGIINGGSGGGSCVRDNSGENFGPGSGTAGQGNNGGTGGGYTGGGGGGAGAAGSGTSGGSGASSSITGSAVTRAGGGGGGNRQAAGGGSGGSGGGGQNGGSGTANTGSGGAGGGSDGGAFGPGAGGSGVVIISVPTTSYSNTTTGSPTVTTNGSNTIMTFNSSGSYTG